MEEVLSVLIGNIAALRRPPFSMFLLVGRGRSAICLPVGCKKDEALLRWLREFLLLYGVGSLRLYVFSAFCCEHIV
jgi:hypothetical protein